MGDSSKPTRKTNHRSSERHDNSGRTLGYHKMLSLTEQRTFCGCRGLMYDFPWSNNGCPLGFPWLCGGIPGTEVDSVTGEVVKPPCTNRGVTFADDTNLK